jgi:23S rRNA maturation-related 3'-5' exoribonuclease YhaM
LLQHIKEILDMGEALIKLPQFSIVDWDIFRVSVIMHDLGKLVEYCPETLRYKATRLGRFLGHPAWGIMILEKYWPDSGMESKLRVMHSVISHHGPDHSEVPHATPEAVLLHQLDGLSSKMDVLVTAYKSDDVPEYSNSLKCVPITQKYPE